MNVVIAMSVDVTIIHCKYAMRGASSGAYRADVRMLMFRSSPAPARRASG